MWVKFVTITNVPSFKHRPENYRNGWGIWGTRVFGVLDCGDDEKSEGNFDGLNVGVNVGIRELGEGNGCGENFKRCGSNLKGNFLYSWSGRVRLQILGTNDSPSTDRKSGNGPLTNPSIVP